MSTSTIATLVSTSIDTAWGYITATISPLFAYGMGVAILFGALFFVLRRVHVL